MDIDEGNGQDDTHSIYNSASAHPPPDKQSIPAHHVLSPNHIPNIDDNAFVQQKPNLYKLWSASPPELPSSSSSDEDSTDNNAGRDEYGRIKTGLPQKRVGMGEGELEMEGEWEMRGGMGEEPPDPVSCAVTKPLGPEPDVESGRC